MRSSVYVCVFGRAWYKGCDLSICIKYSVKKIVKSSAVMFLMVQSEHKLRFYPPIATFCRIKEVVNSHYIWGKLKVRVHAAYC